MSMSKYFLRFWILLTLLAITLSSTRLTKADIHPQTNTPEFKAKILLERMTPEERVGQLFLVSFKGRDVAENSQIYDLIARRHIGGVILTNANDNFAEASQTLPEAQRLITDIQTAEWKSSLSQIQDPLKENPSNPVYVPLFVAISQEGDLYPYDQIINGLTPLPSLMAIGATWQPEMAKQVGAVLGRELSALGFNFLLGPSLDVLDVYPAKGSEELGTRTFGGDPYWVSEMGKAYIQGIHTGSENKMVVIAKHFPGMGSSDRPPSEEIATVRRSLEQLKQIELQPFFAVTGKAETREAAADGLLVSHIRYQGFQGNIRVTTRPVSLDSSALEQLMALPYLTSWRQEGGVMVSFNLGSQAVRRFYDPTEQSFDARQVARTAFLAGNDLLYLDNFTASGDADQYTTIVKTLDSFAQKYREDPAFAQRVDASVERLLVLKYRLYPNFILENIIPSPAALETVGTSQQITFEVAQKAATLLDPPASELNAILPHSPERNEKIVIITDVIAERQCTQCELQYTVAVDSLQKTILRLYGPQTGGQISAYQMVSFSFEDVSKMLDGVANPPPIEDELRGASWVVFVIQKVNAKRPSSLAMQRLLSERFELLRNKRVIAFALNAPYFLDATDISKLTAYYGLYSKTAPFIDIAARLLFQELDASGHSPVSVNGLGYDLSVITSPNPEQIIPISLDIPSAESIAPTTSETSPTAPAPTPTQVPTFKVGDTLPLKTGIIYDHNRNPVPDGTLVRFVFSTGTEPGRSEQIEAFTEKGVARAAFRINSPGVLEIRVTSDPAQTSEILRLDITGGEAAAITVIAPTMIVIATPQPTLTPPFETPTATPVAALQEGKKRAPSGGDWLATMIVIWGCAISLFFVSRRVVLDLWAIRWALLANIGGVLAYLYLALGLPGSNYWLDQAGKAGILAAAIIGVLIGWGAGWLWHRYKK